MEQFMNMVLQRIKEVIGQEKEVLIKEVTKNNGVVYHGISIVSKKTNVSPTIYLEQFYGLYQQGESIENIVEHILTVYAKGLPKQRIDMDFFQHFELVRDRIAYKLVNAEKNRELLEDIPHIPFLNLAICFYYAIQSEELGDGIIMIHNSHVKMWGTNHEELMKLAQQNTPELFPARIYRMEDILAEMGTDTSGLFDAEQSQLYVLTNHHKNLGATCLIYPGMLENLAAKVGGGYYVLPSSLHELIIMKDLGEGDPAGFHDMIKEINSYELKEEEVLSDYAYRYDPETGKLSQIL